MSTQPRGNRRKHRRVTLELDAEIDLDDQRTIVGHTRNVSFSGIFVVCDGAGEEWCGRDVVVRVILQPGPDGRQIEIRARIVRADDVGVGIAFQSIGVMDYDDFRSLLIFNSDDPNELIAELRENPGLSIDVAAL